MTADNEYFEHEAAAIRMKRIASLKELAIPRITEIIRNPKSPPRLISLCIQMIGQMGDKQSKHLLLRLLDYKESSTKIEAIIALGKLGDKSVVNELQRVLTDTDQTVVLAANEVIARLTGSELPAIEAVPSTTDTLLNKNSVKDTTKTP
jgi:HEAT repeat protein